MNKEEKLKKVMEMKKEELVRIYLQNLKRLLMKNGKSVDQVKMLFLQEDKLVKKQGKQVKSVFPPH